MDSEAFYEQLDDETYVATDATASPWGEKLQHGSPPTALVAHVMSERFPRDEMRFVRISSEFLGPLPQAPMQVRVRVARPGKRIEMLEAAIASNGRDVLVARAWRIATQPEGSIPAAATPPDAVPSLADAHDPPDWLRGWGYAEALEWRYVYGAGVPGPAAVWSRPRIPLVKGRPLEPLDRALLIADSANGISGELPMSDWLFVPPSLSVAIERYPRGEWVLLEARTTLSSDGIGMTTLRLADPDGYLAAGTQALYVERRG